MHGTFFVALVIVALLVLAYLIRPKRKDKPGNNGQPQTPPSRGTSKHWEN